MKELFNLQSRITFVKAKAFKPKLDFETRISRYCFVKMLVNPKGLTPLLPCTTKNPLLTKFKDLKVAVLRVDLGEEERIRLTPISDDEPKDA